MQQGLLNNGFWAKVQGRPRFERTFPKGSLFNVFEIFFWEFKGFQICYFLILFLGDFEKNYFENQDQIPCRNATGFVK